MWLIALTAAYFFLCGLVTLALLSDEKINTNRWEAYFCVVVGLLWPIAMAVAASVALVENIKAKRVAKKQAEREQLIRFCRNLHKLQLISFETLRTLIWLR